MPINLIIAPSFEENAIEQFKKIKNIIDSDDSRRIVVVSALGKRFSKDNKITDLLYLLSEHIRYGVDYSNIFSLIANRYEEIRTELDLPIDISKEFDKIKEIILCYNDKDYDGRYISEDMRKAMEDYYSIKFRNNYSHIPTLEERKLFVSFKSGLTLQQINDMAYRHFDIMYNQCIDNDLFFSQKIIQASEKYKVNEDEIVYPLFKKNDKFSFLQNADNFEKKVSAAAKGGY